MLARLFRAIIEFFNPPKPVPIKIEIPNPPKEDVPDFAPPVSQPKVKPRFVVDKASHKFMGIKYVQDPDMGGPMTPNGIVLHFTCSYNMANTVDWFKSEAVDIHLLVDKFGDVVQMVPFNKKAAHAGTSEWKGYKSLNNRFIGIEAVNIGPLTLKGGKYYDCYDRVWRGEVVAKTMFGHKYWEPQSAAQVQATISMCAELCKEYGISPEMVIGHQECSPGRKTDPGGTLPVGMDEIRKQIKKEMGAI